MSGKSKKFLGVIFVILGVISIITPFTPFGILLFIGLELLGIRFIFLDRVKSWLNKNKEP